MAKKRLSEDEQIGKFRVTAYERGSYNYYPTDDYTLSRQDAFNLARKMSRDKNIRTFVYELTQHRGRRQRAAFGPDINDAGYGIVRVRAQAREQARSRQGSPPAATPKKKAPPRPAPAKKKAAKKKATRKPSAARGGCAAAVQMWGRSYNAAGKLCEADTADRSEFGQAGGNASAAARPKAKPTKKLVNGRLVKV